ncbi:hypothetical protein IQ247_19265, partial [Plectonema cf. radiosum LEGE 06105]|nr:hypothetical protein [Plectonema cf. radiosum LEGE 06105]
VDAGSFNLTEGASLTASTFGEGNAGSVTVKAKDTVSLTDANIFSRVQAGGVGNGGNITVDAGSFNLTEGAELTASTFGEGKAGSVTVKAKDTVSLTDANIFSTVQAGGVGDGGNITVDAGSFNLTEGASLTASTFGEGNAGSVTVKAKDTVSLTDANIFSRVQAGGVGNGGNITVDAGSFNLTEGAELTASTFGKGKAGSVTVTANDTVSLTDANIFSTVQAGGVGDEGNIEINAANLTLRDSAQLQTITRGASGSQGFPYRPGDAVPSVYSTVGVQSVTNSISEKPRRRWKIGDPIVEPSGVYRLENGQRILSRECSR